jgi:hypothetical protein
MKRSSSLVLGRSRDGFVGVVVLAVLLAGCIAPPGSDGTEPARLSSLSVYEYRFQGDDAAFIGLSYGWMALITNEASRSVVFAVEPIHEETRFAPATTSVWSGGEDVTAERLGPGESRLYLFQTIHGSKVDETGFHVRVLDLSLGPEETMTIGPAGEWNEASFGVLQQATFNRTLQWPETMTKVVPGTHVQTRTVGVWSNGTSFYTNIAELNDDPAFPKGYDPAGFGGAPLPVYVYEDEASEQPPRSRDNCYFVTIGGYNALLKTQAAGGTNVRWLAPEEAYTRPGAEGHHLYGDVLVFMNHVVAVDGTVGPLGPLPDPQGDCFNPEHALPVLPVPLPMP